MASSDDPTSVMTSQFSNKDPERCKHYAKFMSNVSLPAAESIFWLLFMFVLILMCISSIHHHKSINLAEIEKNLPTVHVNSAQYRARVKRLRTQYLSIVTLCFFVATACVTLEAFAAFHIEYCDGEDLMQLYWGFWSILQVGSLIAILGVMLQFWIVLGSHETPSWAVALGTPVLVFAALVWIARAIGRNAWAKLRGRMLDNGDDDEVDDEEKGNVSRWMSRAPTIVPDSSASTTPDRVRRSSTF